MSEAMTRRDQFAAAALTGMLASDAHPDVVLESLMQSDASMRARAVFAYRLADAMILACGPDALGLTDAPAPECYAIPKAICEAFEAEWSVGEFGPVMRAMLNAIQHARGAQ